MYSFDYYETSPYGTLKLILTFAHLFTFFLPYFNSSETGMCLTISSCLSPGMLWLGVARTWFQLCVVTSFESSAESTLHVLIAV